jgi:Resolvase, N terminal domain
MKIGYCRVSTKEQNPDLQLRALKKAGCKTIYTDKESGTVRKRTYLDRCLKELKAGDVLVVWKLDRLGRSLRDLIALLGLYGHRGNVGLCSRWHQARRDSHPGGPRQSGFRRSRLADNFFYGAHLALDAAKQNPRPAASTVCALRRI